MSRTSVGLLCRLQGARGVEKGGSDEKGAKQKRKHKQKPGVSARFGHSVGRPGTVIVNKAAELVSTSEIEESNSGFC
jgi:hypothetical protein